MMRQWTQIQRTLPGMIVLVMIFAIAACAPSTGATPRAGQTPSPTANAVPLLQLTVYGTSDTAMLRALSAETGKMRWQAQTGSASGGKPVVDNGIVYAGSGSYGRVYAFKSSDGTPLWNASLGLSDRGPLVADGVVYGHSIVDDSPNETIFVEALKGTDGTQLWKTQVGSGPFTLVGNFDEFVVDGTVYVAMTAGQDGSFVVCAYNAGNGSLLWSSKGMPVSGGGPNVELVVDGSVVYAYFDRVYAYNRSDGSLLWTSQPSGSSEEIIRGGLSVQQGTVYASTMDGISAFRASDGGLIWHFADHINASAVVNGVVYTTARTSDVYGGAIVALDAKTGKQLWRYEPEKAAQPGQAAIFSVLVVGGGLVFGVKDQGIVALDAATGKVRWATPVGGNLNSPILVGTTLFVDAFQNVSPGSPESSWGYAALDIKTGKQLWTTPINEGITFPSAMTVAA